MSDRFKVVEGSQSCHCCFDWTVVDTTKPVMIGGEHYNNQFDAVCECFERADADRIAAALNAGVSAVDGQTFSPAGTDDQARPLPAAPPPKGEQQ